MWNSSFYAEPAHRAGGSAPSSTSLPQSSRKPPPVGVLSPHLARPISVRDLAQSRVPTVAPPRSSTHSFSFGSGAHPTPSPRTSGGFTGLAVPKAPVVFAATSGVSLGEHSGRPTDVSLTSLQNTVEASDLTSLAARNIDHLNFNDLYTYASHLQDAAKNYSNNLSAAYTKRDMYRSQVAELKQELQERYLQVDLLRRDHERADDALLRLREDNTQLRQLLAESEGKLRNVSARLSLRNGADPSAAMRAYQAQLAQKDAQLRELVERLAQQTAEAAQRLGSEASAAGQRRSHTLSAAADEETRANEQQQHAEEEEARLQAKVRAMEERVREEAREATASAIEAATTVLQAEIDALHQQHATLQSQLAAETASHTQERTELLETIAALRREKGDMQESEDALIAALTLRAPVSKADFESLQASYAELQASLANSEASVASLREQLSKAVVQEGYTEVLQQSLTTTQAERQELVTKTEQLQALVDNLTRELQLADEANQLRQQQMEETAVANSDRWQQSQHTIQELQEREASQVAELQRVRAEMDSLRDELRDLQASRSAMTTTTTATTHNGDITHERTELMAELETLRNTSGDLVRQRDALMSEVRHLEERVQAAKEELSHHSSTPPPALSPASQEGEAIADTAALQVAQQCIMALQHDLEVANSVAARAEADMQAQLAAQEKQVADLAEALRVAQERQREAEEADLNHARAAAAAEHHLKDVVKALKEELELTQAQRTELLQRDKTHQEHHAAQLHVTEQLRERIVDLEKRASEVRPHEPTPPSTQPTHISARTSTATEAETEKVRLTTMSAAIDRMAEQLAASEDRVRDLEAERQRQADELEHARRAHAALEDRVVAHERGSRAVASDGGASAAPAPEHAMRVLAAERDAACAEMAELRSLLQSHEAHYAADLAAMEQRISSVGEELRVSKAALEQMATDLTTATHLVGSLTAEKTQLEAEKVDLSTALDAAQSSAVNAQKENDALVATDTERQNKLDAAQAAVSAAMQARNAAEQRATTAEEEVRAAKAALEQMAGDAADTAQQCAALSAANTELEAKVLSLASEFAAAQDMLMTLNSERDSNAEQESTASQKVQAAEARASAAAAELSAVTHRVSASEDEVRAAKAALEKMAGDLSDAEGAVQILTAAKSTLEAESASLKAALFAAEQTAATLAAERSSHAGTESEARAMLEAAEAEASVVAAELSTAQQRLAASEEEVRAAKAALEQMAGDAADTAQQCAVLSAANTELEAKVLSLASELAAAQETVVALTSERDSRAESESTASQKLKAAEARAAELASKASELEQRVGTTTKELRVAKAALEKVVADFTESTRLAELLSAGKADVEVENAALKGDIAAAQAALFSLRAERDKDNGSDSTVNAKVEAAEAMASAAAAELSAMTHRVAASEDEVRVAKAALEKMGADLFDATQLVEYLTASQSQLEAEKARLYSALSLAEESVATLRKEHNSCSMKDSEVRARLEAAEAMALNAAAEVRALQQRIATTEEELRVSRAAVDSMAGTMTASAHNSDSALARQTSLQDDVVAAEARIASLTVECSSARDEAAQLFVQAQAAEARSVAVTADRATMEERMNAAVEELRVSKAALEQMAADFTTATRLVGSLTAEKTLLEAEKIKLSTALDAAQSSAVDARKENDALVATDTERQDKLDAAQAAVSAAMQARNAAEQRATTAEEEVRAAKAALEQMAGDAADTAQHCAVLSTANTELEAKVLSLVSELAAAQETVMTFTSERDSRAERESTAVQKVDAAEARASAAAAELSAVTHRVSASEDEVRAAKAALEKMAGDLSDAEGAVQILTAAKSTLEAESASLKAALSAAEQTAATLAAERSSHAGTESETRAMLEAAEAEASVVAAELSTAQQRLAASEEEVRAAKAALEQMAGDAADTAQQCAVLSAANTELEAKVLSLVSELAAAQETVVALTSERDNHAESESTASQKLQAAETRAAELASKASELEQRVGSTAEELRVAKAALEKVVADFTESTQRANDLQLANTALEALRSQDVADLASAQERVAATEAKLNVSESAVEKVAAELSNSAKRLEFLLAVKADVEEQYKQRSAELQLVEQRVAALESRLGDAERRSADAATAAEQLLSTYTTKCDELEKANARLREQLSEARSAVNTLAEECTSATAQSSTLAQKGETEAELRKTAEAAVVTLQEELSSAKAAIAQLTDDLTAQRDYNDTVQTARAAQEEAMAVLVSKAAEDSAELAEVRRRGEELQTMLDTTLDRLAQKELLLEEVNDNAAELHKERAALADDVVTLRSALETAVVERQDLQERLAAANEGLERTAELYNERILEDDRMQEELNAVSAAFAAQTQEMRAGLAAMTEMSAGFCNVLETVMAPAKETLLAITDAAASSTDGGAGGGAASARSSQLISAITIALAPWSAALDWAGKMERRLDALERGRAAVDGEGDAKADTDAASTPPSSSPLSHASDPATARSALLDFVQYNEAALGHLHHIRRTMADRDDELRQLRSALDSMADATVEERERVDHLLSAIQDAKDHVARAEREFDEQLRLRSEAITAELVVARRAEERATDARVRAETELAATAEELRESHLALRKLQEEHRKLTRETERLSRYSARLTDTSAARGRGGLSGSVTPTISAMLAETATNSYAVTASAVEALEQSNLLQVSSLQQDLLLSRRHARDLEGREALLRQNHSTLEQEVVSLRVEAAEAADLREEVATLRADNAELEERCEQLERMLAAAGGGTMQELKSLRTQLKLKETELADLRARMRDFLLNRSTSEFEVVRREGDLRETLSGITTQLAATQAQYSGGRTARERGTALLSGGAGGTAGDEASPQGVLSSRIDHLENVVRERDAVIEKMQASQLESRVTVDGLQENLSEKEAALDRANTLLAQYAETIETLHSAGVAGTTTRQLPATPRRTLSESPHSARSRNNTASVPPPTPLGMSSMHDDTAGSISRAGVTAPMASPAPRMPNLDEVAGEEEGENSSAGDEAEAPSESPASVRRRTGSNGQRSSRRAGGRRSSEERTSADAPVPSRSATRSASATTTAAAGRKRGRPPTRK